MKNISCVAIPKSYTIEYTLKKYQTKPQKIRRKMKEKSKPQVLTRVQTTKIENLATEHW